MDLKSIIGLGVAGNFTGHLEQAGEAEDFANIKVQDEKAPKGLFPFYSNSKTGKFIEIYPLSSSKISRPPKGESLQIEPEVALICEISYNKGQVIDLKPKKFTAFNDCTIRKPGAKKISEKKNWGKNSKGISLTHIDIDGFSRGGVMDTYRLACYLKRDNELHEYGIDSPLIGYSYFYEKLLNWIVFKMNTQNDEGPLESIAMHLKESGYPVNAVIAIGSTRYTEFGESTFLDVGDESFIIIYDSKLHTRRSVEKLIQDSNYTVSGLSILHQIVV